ncbi:hypothetical protein CkaCkLH20_08365 [Colletotrichum karsti]|uniref:Uncharacterized protein n=1 Tax=Colletotrichum karsti TaxID=1095194 RepID=A0A9P6I008_9PEZI|nr:uncharacterized protein CkaCkLH20_08365 [Colletotrichum karsti]KAF9873993.1 hypothetical protein CkaCkLH20_08365 [Colletotrichum karsti]
MIVILTAILTSTLTQSTVTYPTRLTPTLPKPVIPRAVKLYSWSPNLYYYLHAELEFDASIQAGLSHSHDSEFPFDQPRCPTTECVWDVVSTLGVCVKTWNVTAFLNVTYGDGDSSHVLKFASLPNGAYSNLSILSSGMVSLNNGQQPMYTAFDESEIPKTRISEFSIIYSVHNQGVRAVEAMFYFCIQRYNVSVHNNIASRELIDATVDSGYFLFNITQTSSPINLTGLKVPGEPNTKFPYGGRVVPLLRDSLDHALNGTFSQISSPGSERGRAPSRFFSAFDEMYTPDTKHKMGDAVTNITNNVARSLSNSLSTDPANVTGEAFITETYVKVRWAWLAFISSQIVLSTIVLAVTIIQARNAGLGIVKSSTLPAFFVIDTHDRELLENGKGLKKQQEEVDDLLKEGHGVGWKLGLTDHALPYSDIDFDIDAELVAFAAETATAFTNMIESGLHILSSLRSLEARLAPSTDYMTTRSRLPAYSSQLLSLVVLDCDGVVASLL